MPTHAVCANVVLFNTFGPALTTRFNEPAGRLLPPKSWNVPSGRVWIVLKPVIVVPDGLVIITFRSTPVGKPLPENTGLQPATDVTVTAPRRAGAVIWIVGLFVFPVFPTNAFTW